MAEKVTLEFTVDFMKMPIKPPTLENCMKCVFHRLDFHCESIKKKKCGIGLNGYYAGGRNAIKEVI